MPINEESLTLQDVGAYFATTDVWDIEAFKEMDLNSTQFKELMVRLYQNIGNISTLLNLKDTGYYQQQAFVCGQQFFPDPAQTEKTANPDPSYRMVYRIVLDFGALPNTATKSMAHGIEVTPTSGATSTYTFTRIYGCSTNTTVASYSSIPLPYSSANPIELWVDATNVNIKTTSDYSAYGTTYIVLEYIAS